MRFQILEQNQLARLGLQRIVDRFSIGGILLGMNGVVDDNFRAGFDAILCVRGKTPSEDSVRGFGRTSRWLKS
jgi:hypothetical protein